MVNHKINYCCFCAKTWNIRTEKHCCLCKGNYSKNVNHEHNSLDNESLDIDYDKISRFSTPSVISITHK